MWEEIQDSAGEIFDIDQALEDIKSEKRSREETEEFLDICFDLMMEGLIDEDAIEAEAHKILDEQNN